MRRLLALLSFAVVFSTSALANEVNPAVASLFREWSMTLPTLSRVVICHGFSCAYRTEVGLGSGDHARLAELMAPGKTSAEAERKAVAKTTVWFEKRIAPFTGTANAKARAGGVWAYARDRGQFDCIDSMLYTNSLLIVLNKLGLLRQHAISAPISRLVTGGGPHFTATIQDRKTAQSWTVDPWTHNHGELPDVWPVQKWLAGG
jgi:hypothetical protein